MQRPFWKDSNIVAAGAYRDMNSVRMTEKHSYGELKKYWTIPDFARNVKVRKIPVALVLKSIAILLNFHA